MNSSTSWRKYALALVLVALSSVIGEGVHRSLEPTNLVMLYLLVVVIAAVFLGRGPAVLTSIVSVLAFDVLFVPPRFSLTVYDTQYLITFASLLAVGLIISELTSRMRERTMHALERERKAVSLYHLSRDLSKGFDLRTLLFLVKSAILNELQSHSILYLVDGNRLMLPEETVASPEEEREKSVATWVFQSKQTAGCGTSSLPDAKRAYFPLTSGEKVLGVLGVEKSHPMRDFSQQDMQWIETMANQTAVAMERVLLFEETKKMALLKEKEKLQTALLHSISHDLRTPLVSVTGTLSHLERSPAIQNDPVQKELVETACEDADRLNKLVTNWLDMTKVESGALRIAAKPCDFKDVLGVVLREMGHRLDHREMRVDIPDAIPDVRIDYALMLKVIGNLLDNAIKYSDAATPVEITSRLADETLEIEILDRGMGIPKKDLDRVFEKFYRASNVKEKNIPGTGLGLSICKAIVEAHAGSIHAFERPGGGTLIKLSLPVQKSAHAS